MRLATRYRNPKTTKLVFNFYLLFTFFLFFGDSLMSYSLPVFLDEKLNNALLLGFVYASSSVVGLIYDFLGGKSFGNKSFSYFFKFAVITAITFPLTLLLFPNSIIAYLVAMALWGLYYEADAFANVIFIESTKEKGQFTETWSLVSTILSIATFVGPLVASFLISYFVELNFYVAIFLYLIAFLSYRAIKSQVRDEPRVEETKEMHVSTSIELRRWKLLLKRLWPLWIINMLMVMVVAFFWTIGIVYAERLRETTPLAGLMISTFMLPTIVVGALMSRIRIKDGKKRLLLIFATVSGLLLSRFGYTQNILETLGIVALYSTFSTVAFNLLYAIYEDYASRAGEFENDIIGLMQAADSTAYIVGPILAGGLATLIGEQLAISYSGVILAVASILCFFIIPRKIHIPHKSLEQIS